MPERVEIDVMSFAPIIAALLVASTALADVGAMIEQFEAMHRDRQCEEDFRLLGVGEKRVRIQEIQPELKHDRTRNVFGFHGPSDIPDYDPKALYIGIANQPDEAGTHHYYVNIGRVHAAREQSFGRKIISNGHIFYNGTVAEIKLPPEVAKALEERAKAGKFGGKMTCLHTVCDLLARENIIIHDRDGQRSVRTKVVVANLVEGKIKIQGKDADPETIRLLTTGPEELRHLLEKATTSDDSVRNKVILHLVKDAAIFVVVGGGLAGGAYGVFQQGSHSEPQKFSPSVDD